jgi:NDP-sugar pyrophosphorylase family protein
VGNKTIIEKIMDTFGDFGARRFHMTVNYKAELLKAYFAELVSPYSFHFHREKEFLGTASSLLLLPETISQTFIVSNCDILVKADYADILESHQRNGAMLTVVSSMHHHTIPYGVVRFSEGGKVDGIDEKPEYSFPINTGVYIMEKQCLERIEPGRLFHMTHLIEALLKEEQSVRTYLVNESDYIDIGQWDEYRTAISRMW